MKPAYTPDNTRSSVMVVLGLAAVVVLIAALIGLSDKPQVDAILISANDAEIAVAPASQTGNSSIAGNSSITDGADPANEDAANDGDTSSEQESGRSDELNQQSDPDTTSAAEQESGDQSAPEPTRQIIPVPTSAPTPTPEIVAAVEPAAEQEAAGTDAAGEVQPAPALPTTSGSVEGTFFTKGDENEGAVVAQNLIQISFAEDGSGAFQGVLDITYVDGTHILLNMSGPLVWLPTNPQVEAMLEGAFTLDALIDTDDVSADDAELTISSLSAGSGSLCTTKCFGFTFPPQ